MGDRYVGEIRNFAFGIVPDGWAPCDGRSIPVRENQALYALLGNIYGGDHINFKLPDLRGRVIVGIGSHRGVAYEQGKPGGVESVALAQAQLPSHTHSFLAIKEAATYPAPQGAVLSASGTSSKVTTQQQLYAPLGNTPVTLNPGTLNTVGANAPHTNMQPFEVTNFCIAISGYWPPRAD